MFFTHSKVKPNHFQAPNGLAHTVSLSVWGGRLVIGRLNTHQQVRDGEMDEEEGHPRLDASVAPQQNATELNSRPDMSQLKRGENHQGFALVSSMKARLRDSPLNQHSFSL